MRLDNLRFWWLDEWLHRSLAARRISTVVCVLREVRSRIPVTHRLGVSKVIRLDIWCRWKLQLVFKLVYFNCFLRNFRLLAESILLFLDCIILVIFRYCFELSKTNNFLVIHGL
jgi:hypothetical protein